MNPSKDETKKNRKIKTPKCRALLQTTHFSHFVCLKRRRRHLPRGCVGVYWFGFHDQLKPWNTALDRRLKEYHFAAWDYCSKGKFTWLAFIRIQHLSHDLATDLPYERLHCTAIHYLGIEISHFTGHNHSLIHTPCLIVLPRSPVLSVVRLVPHAHALNFHIQLDPKRHEPRWITGRGFPAANEPRLNTPEGPAPDDLAGHWPEEPYQLRETLPRTCL